MLRPGYVRLGYSKLVLFSTGEVILGPVRPG